MWWSLINGVALRNVLKVDSGSPDVAVGLGLLLVALLRELRVGIAKTVGGLDPKFVDGTHLSNLADKAETTLLNIQRVVDPQFSDAPDVLARRLAGVPVNLAPGDYLEVLRRGLWTVRAGPVAEAAHWQRSRLWTQAGKALAMVRMICGPKHLMALALTSILDVRCPLS